MYNIGLHSVADKLTTMSEPTAAASRPFNQRFSKRIIADTATIANVKVAGKSSWFEAVKPARSQELVSRVAAKANLDQEPPKMEVPLPETESAYHWPT